MAKMKSNKLITNFPVALSDVENQNLSLTLSGVVTRNGLWRPSVTAGGEISWEYDDSNSKVPPDSQNIRGPEGKAPFLMVDPANSHLKWSRDQITWYDTYQTTSGAVGQKGPQGPQGIQGIQGIQGKDGDPGRDGVSPSVSTSVINPDTSHPKGGTEVTITDSAGQHRFEIWNGADGAGATVTLLAGSGIGIQADGTNYTITVSADYALRSELPDLSQYATETWVGQQGYLKASDLTDYATKAYANDASANALSQAKSWVESQHYLTSVPESYATKTYANDTSANVKSWVESEKYLKAVAQNLSLSGDGTTEHPLGIDEAGMAANNLYGWNYSTHTWSAIPSSVTQVEHDNTLSGNGTSSSKLGIDGAMVTRWNAASALSATKLDKTVWDEYSGTFVNKPSGAGVANKYFLYNTFGGSDPWSDANNWLCNAFVGENGVYVTPEGAQEKIHIGLSGDYLPKTGGTVSGQLEVHGGSNFDSQFIKLTREGNSCGARIGLGSDTTNGTLALKTFNTQGQNTVQVNIKYNSNSELIQVQKDGNTVGHLIPAVVHQGSYTPSSDDGILHIVVEN